MCKPSGDFMTRVLVPEALLAEILSQARKPRAFNEAGGLLLGLRKDNALHLTKLTLPKPWDRATPVLFERSARGHRFAALRAWKASFGKVDWVGEWHTHPLGAAAPSLTDQTSWRKLANHVKRPMALIIGGRTDIFVGVQDPGSRDVRRLDAIELDETYCLFG